jgi:hypothetical protein
VSEIGVLAPNYFIAGPDRAWYSDVETGFGQGSLSSQKGGAMSRSIRGLAGLAAGLFLATSAAFAQPQSKSEQRCINTVNKGASKVEASQTKANNGCIRDFLKGKIAGPNAAESCLLDDPKEKVEARQSALLAKEAAKCDSMDPPDFAYTSGLFAGTTAYQSQVDLIHDMYGNPVENGLLLCDPFEAECFCQLFTNKRVLKLTRTFSMIFNKCKAAALAGKLSEFPGGANDIGDIERCVTDANLEMSVQADRLGRLADRTAHLGATIDAFCNPAVSGEFAGGLCANLSGAALVDCLRDRIECRFCRMWNAIDNMAIDCAAWSGAACP